MHYAPRKPDRDVLALTEADHVQKYQTFWASLMTGRLESLMKHGSMRKHVGIAGFTHLSSARYSKQIVAPSNSTECWEQFSPIMAAMWVIADKTREDIISA